MSDLLSARDIEKISYEILKGSKSLGVFPTPVDRIIAYSEMIVREDVDISVIHDSYLTKATDALRGAMAKVRGLLFRPNREIFLDLSQLKERKNFVKLHEVGHQVLPWQRNVHDILDDDDRTLGDFANNEFEDEANYFASITLFQHDLFHQELNRLDLSLASGMHLSKVFGSSIHAALRRYVEHSKNRCALLILENISPNGTPAKCDLRNKFQSSLFKETFGELIVPKVFGFTWLFVQDYYFGKKMTGKKSITLTTDNGEVDFIYQFFNNGYNGFVFLYPIGETKSARTKIIVPENIMAETVEPLKGKRKRSTGN